MQIKEVMQTLNYITVTVNGNEVQFTLDSYTQISIFYPTDVPFLEDKNGKLILSFVAGEQIKMKLVKEYIANDNKRNNISGIPVKIMVAVTDKLKGNSLLTPNIFKILECHRKMFFNPTIYSDLQ